MNDVELLKLDDALERTFYEMQAVAERWSVAELKRQKAASLFLRLANSKDKAGVLRLPIVLPSVPEQTAIAVVLSGMDTELKALEARREKTHALKQAMMQELLTGKTRLVPPAKQPEHISQ